MRGWRQHRRLQETPNCLLVLSSRASSFTRCLLNKADGRQAGPPSLVIGARAAAKPECFYLRAPGSTSIPSIRILAEPRKPNFCAGAIPLHYYPAAHCNPLQSCDLIRRESRLPNPAVLGGMAVEER